MPSLSHSFQFLFPWFLSAVLCQYALLSKESSGTLHGLIYCDTFSENIRLVTTADHSRLNAALETIAATTEMELTVSSFDGSSSFPSWLHRWSLHARIGANDVIFCYFSCHGWRAPGQQTPWPCLLFPLTMSSLDGSWIVDAILRQRPRLAIILFECCNITVPSQPKGAPYRNVFPLSPSGIQRLFSETTGTAIVCSASPGQFAYGIAGPSTDPALTGGLFTTCFLSALSEASWLPTSSWGTIVHNATWLCQSVSSSLIGHRQMPFSVVSTAAISRPESTYTESR